MCRKRSSKEHTMSLDTGKWQGAEMAEYAIHLIVKIVILLLDSED